MNWLDSALDYGISEWEFWDMTLAELERAIESKKRMMRLKEQERASYDYILADLIGRSVGRIYSDNAEYPPIYEAYPSLFDADQMQEQKQQKLDELSALRFKQFAASFNKKLNKEVAKD